MTIPFSYISHTTHALPHGSMGSPVKLIPHEVVDVLLDNALHHLDSLGVGRRVHLDVGFEAPPEAVLQVLRRTQTSQAPVHLFQD